MIANRGQQYAGYRELGAGIELGAAPMSIDEAAAFIALHSGDPNLGAFEVLQTWAECGASSYRMAAKRLHPDAGGDPQLFKQLQEAKEVLDR